MLYTNTIIKNCGVCGAAQPGEARQVGGAGPLADAPKEPARVVAADRLPWPGLSTGRRKRRRFQHWIPAKRTGAGAALYHRPMGCHKINRLPG